MRFPAVFLLVATLTTAAFAADSDSNLRSDVKKEPIYPPSAPTNTATPSGNPSPPQSAPVVRQTVPTPANGAAPFAPPAVPVQTAQPTQGVAPAQSAPAINSQLAPAPAATQPATTVAVQPATTPAPVSDNGAAVEVGFDPKVKRDPWGKVVKSKDGSSTAEAEKAPKAITQAKSTDKSSGLRSDVKPASAPKPAAAPSAPRPPMAAAPTR